MLQNNYRFIVTHGHQSAVIGFNYITLALADRIHSDVQISG